MLSVTLLDSERNKFAARSAELLGKRLNLVVPRHVEPGALVEVEWDDALLLGEICCCAPEGLEFSAGIMLEHAVWNLSEVQAQPQKVRVRAAAATAR